MASEERLEDLKKQFTEHAKAIRTEMDNIAWLKEVETELIIKIRTNIPRQR